MLDDIVDNSWNSLGSCMKIAGTSDAACLLFVAIV